MQYKRGNETKNVLVQGGKVLCTIKINGRWVSNPTLEQFLAQGWEEYTPDPVQPVQPTYEETYKNKVVELIRQQYDINDEFAIHRHKDDEPEAWQQYFNYVETCKEEARQWTEKFMEEIKK